MRIEAIFEEYGIECNYKKKRISKIKRFLKKKKSEKIIDEKAIELKFKDASAFAKKVEMNEVEQKIFSIVAPAISVQLEQKDNSCVLKFENTYGQGMYYFVEVLVSDSARATKLLGKEHEIKRIFNEQKANEEASNVCIEIVMGFPEQLAKNLKIEHLNTKINEWIKKENGGVTSG